MCHRRTVICVTVTIHRATGLSDDHRGTRIRSGRGRRGVVHVLHLNFIGMLMARATGTVVGLVGARVGWRAGAAADLGVATRVGRATAGARRTPDLGVYFVYRGISEEGRGKRKVRDGGQPTDQRRGRMEAAGRNEGEGG